MLNSLRFIAAIAVIAVGLAGAAFAARHAKPQASAAPDINGMGTGRGATSVVGEARTTRVASASSKLPTRSGPRPYTTRHVPHVQLGIDPVPEISKELLRRASKLPGVEIRDTIVSLPGALGFWINKTVKLTRPEVIVRGREFAHVHPDGSLHAALPPQLARKAVSAGWAIAHPWAKRRAGWEGFVMIYTPRSKAELDVVFRLVAASYTFVTGKAVGETDS